MLVEINLHLVLCVGEFSIKSLVVTGVDIAENSLFQLLGSARDTRVVNKPGLGKDAGQMLVHGCTIAVIATFLSQFRIINHIKA